MNDQRPKDYFLLRYPQLAQNFQRKFDLVDSKQIVGEVFAF